MHGSLYLRGKNGMRSCSVAENKRDGSWIRYKRTSVEDKEGPFGIYDDAFALQPGLSSFCYDLRLGLFSQCLSKKSILLFNSNIFHSVLAFEFSQ